MYSDRAFPTTSFGCHLSVHGKGAAPERFAAVSTATACLRRRSGDADRRAARHLRALRSELLRARTSPVRRRAGFVSLFVAAIVLAKVTCPDPGCETRSAAHDISSAHAFERQTRCVQKLAFGLALVVLHLAALGNQGRTHGRHDKSHLDCEADHGAHADRGLRLRGRARLLPVPRVLLRRPTAATPGRRKSLRPRPSDVQRTPRPGNSSLTVARDLVVDSSSASAAVASAGATVGASAIGGPGGFSLGGALRSPRRR